MVVSAGFSFALGLHVIIDCGNALSTTLAYLGELGVDRLATLRSGEVLGHSDRSGAIVHFELRWDGIAIDPESLLEFIRVKDRVTPTQTPSVTPTPTSTPLPTSTPRPWRSRPSTTAPATATPTPTPILPTATPTNTPPPTSTATITPTPTPQPTATPRPPTATPTEPPFARY